MKYPKGRYGEQYLDISQGYLGMDFCLRKNDKTFYWSEKMNSKGAYDGNNRSYSPYDRSLQVITPAGWVMFDWDSFNSVDEALVHLKELPQHHVKHKGCPVSRPTTPKNHNPHG